MLTLRLFGGLVVEAEDGPVRGRAAQKKRVAVLPLLVTAPGGTLSRDKLAAVLWPESDKGRARHQLSSSVYEMRRASAPEAILSVADNLQLNSELVWSDVAAFQAAVREARWRDAVVLYGGPFLDGFFLGAAPEFDRWMERERDRWARSYAGVLRALAGSAERDHDRLGAVSWWQRLADHQPYSSEVALALMRAMEGLGDRPAAIRHAAVHGARMRTQLGAEPDPSLAAYARDLARSPASTRPELPRPPTSGRDPPAAPRRPGARAREDPAPMSDRTYSDTPATAFPLRALAALVAVLTLTVLGGLAWASWPWTAPAPGAAPMSRLVVLPFETGPSPVDDHLGDGIAGEITGELTRIRGLTVISSTSAMRYRGSGKTVRQIARELGVHAVVQGGVFRTEDDLRIDARLTYGRTGGLVWSRTYDGSVREAVELNRRVALDILAASGASAAIPARQALRLPAGRPVEAEAYDVYLRGRYAGRQLNAEADQIAVGHYLRAIEIDPSFALPLSALAALYARVGHHAYVHHPADHGRAARLAEAALALDSMLPEPFIVVAEVELHSRNDWEASSRALTRAQSIAPGSATTHFHRGYHLLARGDFDEAIAAMRRATELDPLARHRPAELAWTYYMARRPDDALRLCRLILSRDPGNATAYGVMALALQFQGRYQEALTALRQAAGLSGHRAINRATVVQVLASMDRTDEARQALEDLNATTTPPGTSLYRLAGIHLLLGERDEALSLLEASYEAREGAVIWIRVDPVLEDLRDEPRLVALGRELGLL